MGRDRGSGRRQFDMAWIPAILRTGAAWASFLFGDTPPRGRQLSLPCFDPTVTVHNTPRLAARLPIMMPETEHDTIQIGQESEVNYSEALRKGLGKRDERRMQCRSKERLLE